MQQLVDDIQKDYLKDDIPNFDVGDTIQVHVIISEGGAKRTQRFEGYVTARKGDGLDETFTVRKMVQGEGVERVFPLHSPKIDRIEKVQSGRVRRSKLYYLSEQKGKAAEIREDTDEDEGQEESPAQDTEHTTDSAESSTEDQTEQDETGDVENETEQGETTSETDKADASDEEEAESSEHEEETEESKGENT